MKSRATLLRLKRFQVDEKRRRVTQIEAMIGQPVSLIELADFELNVQSPSQAEWSLELATLWRADGART